MRIGCFTHSLADVLSCEDHVAGPTSEAADVPLFLQRQERLTLLDLVSTPSTVWRRVACERASKKNGKRDRERQTEREEMERRGEGMEGEEETEKDKVSQGVIVHL